MSLCRPTRARATQRYSHPISHRSTNSFLVLKGDFQLVDDLETPESTPSATTSDSSGSSGGVEAGGADGEEAAARGEGLGGGQRTRRSLSGGGGLDDGVYPEGEGEEEENEEQVLKMPERTRSRALLLPPFGGSTEEVKEDDGDDGVQIVVGVGLEVRSIVMGIHCRPLASHQDHQRYVYGSVLEEHVCTTNGC